MEIKAFKALRFNSKVVGNAGDCIAPPYDVINEQLRERLYAKNNYNVVRLTRNKPTAKDNDTNNPYTRAAALLNEWIKKGALKEDQAETIYAYVQNFEIAGRKYQRGTFISLAKLEEYGSGVKPHENTLSGPKADRLNLQRATGAKFGLIFMLYNDPAKTADGIIDKTAKSSKPLIEFADEDGVKHKLFAITQTGDIRTICELMKDKSCVIADGHHRYQTALDYYAETKNPKAQYQIMAFANTQNKGMIVLATHRLVYGLKGFTTEKLLEGLKANFEITEYPFKTDADKPAAKAKMLGQMKKVWNNNGNAYGVYTGNDKFYVASLSDKVVMDSALPGKSAAYKQLQVSVLHKLVFEDLLGIGEKELAEKSNLEYIKDTPNAIDDTISRVEAGEIQAAFFLNPEKMDMIQKVADAGEKMPQKSTFFFPKVYSGMTIYKM